MYLPSALFNSTIKGIQTDLISRMLNIGCIFIYDKITPHTATLFLAQVQHIAIDLKIKTISVYINSGGGCSYSGLAIVDIMRYGFEKCTFHTYCVGIAASAASIILAVGHKRFMSANSVVMIHQPAVYSANGRSSDIEILSKELHKLRKIAAGIYSKYSKNSFDYYMKAMENDNYLDYNEVKELGLVDEIFGESFLNEEQKPDNNIK